MKLLVGSNQDTERKAKFVHSYNNVVGFLQLPFIDESHVEGLSDRERATVNVGPSRFG